MCTFINVIRVRVPWFQNMVFWVAKVLCMACKRKMWGLHPRKYSHIHTHTLYTLHTLHTQTATSSLTPCTFLLLLSWLLTLNCKYPNRVKGLLLHHMTSHDTIQVESVLFIKTKCEFFSKEGTTCTPESAKYPCISLCAKVHLFKVRVKNRSITSYVLKIPF